MEMKTKKISKVFAVVLALVVALVSVNPLTAMAATPKATAITLNATSQQMYVGQKFTVAVSKVAPSTASKAVTYKSSSTKIATVSTKGVVTAKAVGTATITVTSKSNSKVVAKCKIVVKKKPTKLTLKAKATTLVAGAATSTGLTKTTLTVTAKNGTADAYNVVTYKSSNTAVATVSADGIVTAKKAGTVTITATSKATSSVKATVKITVKAAPTKITVKEGTKKITTGSTYKVVPTITASTAYNKLTYTSSNTAVATVSTAGVVTAKKAGTATITVASAAKSTVKATVKITVVDKRAFLTKDGNINTYVFDKNADSTTVNVVLRDKERTNTSTAAVIADFVGTITDYLVFVRTDEDLAASFNNGKMDTVIKTLIRSTFMQSLKDEFGYIEVVNNEDGTKTFKAYGESGALIKTFDVSLVKSTPVKYNAVIKCSDGRVIELTDIVKSVGEASKITTIRAIATSVNSEKSAEIMFTIAPDGKNVTLNVLKDDEYKELLVLQDNAKDFTMKLNVALYDEIADIFELDLRLDTLTGSNNY